MISSEQAEAWPVQLRRGTPKVHQRKHQNAARLQQITGGPQRLHWFRKMIKDVVECDDIKLSRGEWMVGKAILHDLEAQFTCHLYGAA